MNRAIQKTVNQEFERLLVKVTRNSSPDSTENKKNKTTTKNTKEDTKRKKILTQKMYKHRRQNRPSEENETDEIHKIP